MKTHPSTSVYDIIDEQSLTIRTEPIFALRLQLRSKSPNVGLLLHLIDFEEKKKNLVPKISIEAKHLLQKLWEHVSTNTNTQGLQ